MVFSMVYCLIGVGIWKFGVRDSYPYFWASYYIQDFYQIGESLLYFPILCVVNILKYLVVHKVINIRRDFWDRLYTVAVHYTLT